MKTNRITAFITGALFLIAMVASLVGGGIIETVLGAPQPLEAAGAGRTQLAAGVLLELVNAAAVIGIAALMYPLLKRVNETLAIAYLALRAIEAVFCGLSAIAPLALIELSQAAGPGGGLEAAGAAAIAERHSAAGLLIPLFFCLGAALFYTGLLRARLAPRPLAVWGLAATAMLLALNLVQTGGLVEIAAAVSMLFALPIIANEIFLGIWLMAKGFSPAAAIPA